MWRWRRLGLGGGAEADEKLTPTERRRAAEKKVSASAAPAAEAKAVKTADAAKVTQRRMVPARSWEEVRSRLKGSDVAEGSTLKQSQQPRS